MIKQVPDDLLAEAPLFKICFQQRTVAQPVHPVREHVAPIQIAAEREMAVAVPLQKVLEMAAHIVFALAIDVQMCGSDSS